VTGCLTVSYRLTVGASPSTSGPIVSAWGLGLCPVEFKDQTTEAQGSKCEE